MRADAGVVGDVTRLLELADQIAEVEQRALHGGRIPGIGIEIAVAFLGRGEQRRAAGKVQYQVAGRDRIVPRRLESERGARRSEEHTSELQSLMRISYA